MKIGLVICSYERPLLLKQCLDSISACKIPKETFIYIVDDCSRDRSVRAHIDSFSPSCDWSPFYSNRNMGIERSLLTGFDYLIGLGSEFIMNLDADSIVKPDFFEKMAWLHNRFPNDIVSGFNTLSKDYQTQKERHPVLFWDYEYVVKQSIGGINMVMSKETYLKYVRTELMSGYGFDWRVCQNIKKAGKYFYITRPSCVQHTGMESEIGGVHSINPDVAFDF